MRLITGILFWSIASFAYITPAAATEGAPITVEFGKRYSLYSEILGEERQVLVRVPDGYVSSDVSTRYPVIYFVDREKFIVQGSVAVSILEFAQQLPKSIVVVFPSNHGTQVRDLRAEKDRFYRFIGEELFAFIDANYRSSDLKTLFGHSIGGYFTLSVLADQPQLFDNYIAASPAIATWNGEVVSKIEHLFTESAANNKSLFLTMTEAAEDGQENSDTMKRMVALLEQKAPETFKWRYDFIGEQVHRSTSFPSLYQGLSYIFSDYQAPSYLSTQAFEEAEGFPALKAFFARRTVKYGTEEGVPQAKLRQIAYLYRDEGMHEQAITFFKRNAEKYPERPRVYKSLGDGYAAAGKLSMALESYQRAVKLAGEQGDEDVNWFTRTLRRLEERMAQE